MSKKLAPWLPIIALGLICVVAGGEYLYKIWARQNKVSMACMHAGALARIGLLEEARRVSTGENRHSQCPGVAKDLRSLRAESTESFERARSRRRAARFARRNVPTGTAAYWRRKAFDAYLEGLAIDPLSAGARRGVRALLRSGRPRSPFKVKTHCRRASRLLHAHLDREARAEYVRVQAAGRVCVDEIAATLQARRLDTRTRLQEAEALERADDRAGARREYREVAAIDPSLRDALDGLARTRPEIPAPISIGWSDVAKAPSLGALGGFVAVVVVFVAIVLAATFLRALRGVGQRPRISPLYHKLGARRLIAETLDIRAPTPLSGIQWKAVRDAAHALRVQPPSAGLGETLPTEGVSITGAAPAVESDAVAAMPLLGRLNAIGRFGRWIAGKRRASVSVEPLGEEGFYVQPWIAWDGTPRGSRQRVVDVPGTAGITQAELAWLLADAIRAQEQSK